MRPVQILTDSCSDLGKDLRDLYHIDYAKMNTVYEGKETPASLDWEYYSPKELYNLMRAGNRVLTTQVPADEFKAIFTNYLEKGYDIVYVGCALKQSGSVNTGEMVAKELLPSYPGASIYCIDAMNACLGEGMLAIRAAEYRDAGMSAKEINDKIIAERKTVNEYLTVHSLDALKKAGRVKASAAFLGNLMGVKPIIIADKNGAQTPIKKVKGRQNSLNEIVKLLKESIIEPENQHIYVAHADCLEEAEAVKALILKEIPCKEVYVGYIGPIIGASVGPDVVAVFGFGREVTFEA